MTPQSSLKNRHSKIVNPEVPTFVLAMTDTYFERSHLVFDSLNTHAPKHRKCLLLIATRKDTLVRPEDFIPKTQDWEVTFIPVAELRSFRPRWPENRPFYACAEGGEFLDFFPFRDDEVILHIDADFVMQRPIWEYEAGVFAAINTGEVIGQPHCFPPCHLEHEYLKLLPRYPMSEARKALPWEDGTTPMLCAGLICCTAATYRTIRGHYLERVDLVTDLFRHHAAGQWLYNWIIHTYLTPIETSPRLHSASWYINTPCYHEEHGGKTFLMYERELVMLNHHKFQPIDYGFVLMK